MNTDARPVPATRRPDTVPESTSRRRGFALPVAIFALVVVGVLVTGAFYVARQETRIGMASQNSGIAFYLAENGISDVVNTTSVSDLTSMALWSDTTVTRTTSDGSVDVTITRTSDRSFFVESESDVSRGGELMGGATRRLGMAAKIFSVQIAPPAALTTRGQVSLRGTAEVHGEDVDPAAWGGFCSGNLTDMPGIATPEDDDVTYDQGAPEVTGNPPVQEDPTIGDATFTQFGDMTYQELTQLADVRISDSNISTLAPQSIDGACLTGQAYPTNWGDPENPGAACGNWFPIVHLTASRATVQSGGVGQGILLVDGDLDLRGNFRFHGIVIVQGRFQTQGSGNRVLGGVMASNADFDQQNLVGGSVVNYSSCGVERALLGNNGLTRMRPIASRSWVDMSNIAN